MDAFESAHLPALIWARELAERQAKNPLYLPRALSNQRRSSRKRPRWDGIVARRISFQVDHRETRLTLYKSDDKKLRLLDSQTTSREATFELADADTLCIQIGCKTPNRDAVAADQGGALNACGATHAALVPLSTFVATNIDQIVSPGARGEKVDVKLLPNKTSSGSQARVVKVRACLLSAAAAAPNDDVQESMKTYYHLMFRNDEGKLESKVEARRDGRCPWCDQKIPGDSANVLLAHLQAHHSPSLKFQAVKKDDAVHVLALPRELQRQGEDEEDEDDEVSRELPEVPTVTDEMSLRRALSNKKSAAPPPPPPRQYYHARTLAPIVGDALDYPDSDDDVDEDWRLEVSNQLLDEFDDVTLCEKQFMKMWNAYVFRHPIRADSLLPDSCLSFAKTHRDQLLKHNLRHNFLLHLLNLWDNSLLDATHIASCLRQVDHQDGEQEEDHHQVTLNKSS